MKLPQKLKVNLKVLGSTLSLALGVVLLGIAIKTTPSDTNITTVTKIQTPLVDTVQAEPVKTTEKLVKTLSINTTRIVAINGEVDEISIGQAMAQLLLLQNVSSAPIYVVLNSPGGSVFDGELFISAMESSKAPVYTICQSLCASMAAHIHAHGKKRYVYDRAILMYHEAAGGVRGDLNKARSLLNFVTRKIAKLDAYIAMRAGMSPEKFQKLKQDELWVDGEDAKTLNLADDIVSIGNEMAPVSGSSGEESKKKRNSVISPNVPDLIKPMMLFDNTGFYLNL